jgi:hypothetical protein
MVGTCAMLFFLLVLSNSVSAWITWYASTHNDFNTTPGAGDSNEVSHQTDNTTNIPGKSMFSFLIRLLAALSASTSLLVR